MCHGYRGDGFSGSTHQKKAMIREQVRVLYRRQEEMTDLRRKPYCQAMHQLTAGEWTSGMISF
jgi:hypothetical protein